MLKYLSSKEYVGYNDIWLMLAGVPIASFIVNGILFSPMFIDPDWKLISSCFFVGIVHVVTFWIVFRFVFFYCIDKFGYQTKRYLALFIGIGIAYYIFDEILKWALDPWFHSIHDLGAKPHAFLEALSALVISSIVVLVYEGSYLTFRIKKIELEKSRLQSEHISSQLEGLKNKVSPHFLFNSLNTLCNLIPESQERAERFVRKLSKVYRYILEIRDKKLISLKEEIDYLNSYTYLLKERFMENISINIDIDPKHHDKMVIPLASQILMENAIKHNIISKDQPLHIDVFIDDTGKLVVKNNLQKKKNVPSSTKFGLENIKERYKFFTDKSVDVIPTTQHFIVVLPLITNE